MDKLSGSESVYGFAGWLTTRKTITEMGSSKECGVIARLVDEFCKANNLKEPRSNYHEDLTFPTE